MRTKPLVMTHRTYEADAKHIETAMILMTSCRINVKAGEPTPVKLGVGKGGTRSAWRMSCFGWTTQMMNEKEIEKQKLLNELMESSKSQEDKLTSARVVTNQDSQKAANAIKGLMSRKWQ